MKYLKYLFISCFIFFICLNVKALPLTYNNTKEITTSINYLYQDQDNYFVIKDNNLSSYHQNKLIAEKSFANLTNLKIISYNKEYLLIGLENMSLKIYYLDSYLQVLASNELSLTSLNNYTLYTYNNKVYLLDLINGTLNSTKIYEIDKDLVITENNLSSYSSEELISILHSDYYLIHQTGNNNLYYNASTSLDNNHILVGYKLNDDNSKIALISILKEDGSLVSEITNNEQTEFTKVEIINDMIITLSNDETNSYLSFYTLDGTYLDKITILNSLTNQIYRINSSLYLLDNTKINIYDYKCYIKTNNEPYGSVTVNKEASPYKKVEILVKPNSGYQVSNIIVKDSKGNTIPVTDSTFTMPPYDVNIIVEYTNTIVNPETIDYITIAIISFIILSILTIYVYKKYQWLK